MGFVHTTAFPRRGPCLEPVLRPPPRWTRSSSATCSASSVAESLARRQVSGAVILTATMLGVSAANYLLNLVLARFLSPAEFGDANLAVNLVLAAAAGAATLQLLSARNGATGDPAAVESRRQADALGLGNRSSTGNRDGARLPGARRRAQHIHAAPVRGDRDRTARLPGPGSPARSVAGGPATRAPRDQLRRRGHCSGGHRATHAGAGVRRGGSSGRHIPFLRGLGTDRPPQGHLRRSSGQRRGHEGGRTGGSTPQRCPSRRRCC